MLRAASEVGDGANTLFWRDRWLRGPNLGELGPILFRLVPTRIKNKRTALAALTYLSWVNDLHGAVTWPVRLLFGNSCKYGDCSLISPFSQASATSIFGSLLL